VDPTGGTPGTQQAAPLLTPEQLDTMVAPVALYPDPVLSQVLSACTYPLEIVEAQQWLSQHKNLTGTQLVEAAKQQNWDASVQALVVFPNALGLLANDIRWATALGNAFLAQQADVMSAVQRMRARAKANGKLASTPEQVVTTTNQDGQAAIVIQPANPQVIYVPVYSPNYIWGPPLWGAYAYPWYPAGFSFGFGFGFGPAYYMSAYYPGWAGWGGWGWGFGWFGGGLYVNVGFFNHYGYHCGGYGYYSGRGYYGGYPAAAGYAGRTAWVHDPGHRMGIPYPNRAVAGRYGVSNMGGAQYASRTAPAQFSRAAATPLSAGARTAASPGWQRFGEPGRVQSNVQPESRGNMRTGDASPRWSTSGNTAGPAAPRSSSAMSRGFVAPQSASAPRTSWANGSAAPRSSPAAGQGFTAPRTSGASGYSAARSFAAPSQNFGAPHSFSAPRTSGMGGFSAPRTSSAPSQGFSASRPFGGGGTGFSGARSGGGGFSGGHFGGGGGGGGHHR
jgi:hypothetical protein